LDFVALTVNLLVLNQIDIFERFVFTFVLVWAKFGLAKLKHVSTAKRRGLQLTQKRRSFLYFSASAVNNLKPHSDNTYRQSNIAYS